MEAVLAASIVVPLYVERLVTDSVSMAIVAIGAKVALMEIGVRHGEVVLGL